MARSRFAEHGLSKRTILHSRFRDPLLLQRPDRYLVRLQSVPAPLSYWGLGLFKQPQRPRIRTLQEMVPDRAGSAEAPARHLFGFSADLTNKLVGHPSFEVHVAVDLDLAPPIAFFKKPDLGAPPQRLTRRSIVDPWPRANVQG